MDYIWSSHKSVPLHSEKHWADMVIGRSEGCLPAQKGALSSGGEFVHSSGMPPHSCRMWVEAGLFCGQRPCKSVEPGEGLLKAVVLLHMPKSLYDSRGKTTSR